MEVETEVEKMKKGLKESHKKVQIIRDDQDLISKLRREYIDVGGLRIGFQRTVRVPEGKVNDLPANLGSFPIYSTTHFRSGIPKEWKDDCYFMPMYGQEAMWISFGRGQHKNPKALIVGAGNINAVSGKPFGIQKSRKKESLDIKLEKDQNYLVVPPQPWLDGWKDKDGKIYQFVAAELGSGETVEGQITGKEDVGGIQLIVYDANKELIPESTPHEYIKAGSCSKGLVYALCAEGETSGSKGICRRAVTSMGLGRGGEINQKIYPDPHGLKVWKDAPEEAQVVYLVSSEDFKQITGHDAPPTPITYKTYQQYGLPWFDLWDKNLGDTQGSDVFSKLKPVGEGKIK